MKNSYHEEYVIEGEGGKCVICEQEIPAGIYHKCVTDEHIMQSNLPVGITGSMSTFVTCPYCHTLHLKDGYHVCSSQPYQGTSIPQT